MRTLALAMILCAAATAALAQSKDERRDWAAMDTDRDGRVSPAEFAVLR